MGKMLLGVVISAVVVLATIYLYNKFSGSTIATLGV